MSTRSLQEPFDRNKYYAIDGDRMERVRETVLALYHERLHTEPDGMRDAAKRLEWAVYDACEVPEEMLQPSTWGRIAEALDSIARSVEKLEDSEGTRRSLSIHLSAFAVWCHEKATTMFKEADDVRSED